MGRLQKILNSAGVEAVASTSEDATLAEEIEEVYKLHLSEEDERVILFGLAFNLQANPANSMLAFLSAERKVTEHLHKIALLEARYDECEKLEASLKKEGADV